MSLSSASASAPEATSPSDSDRIRLHGRGLLIARGGWIVLTLLGLVATIILEIKGFEEAHA